MMPKPSFFDNLRRRSFRRSPPGSRASSSQAINVADLINGNVNGTHNPSIAGVTNGSVNGQPMPGAPLVFDNNSQLTIDTPESNSASPSEVSSSEMNPQAPNGNTARPASARPMMNSNRNSMYMNGQPESPPPFSSPLAPRVLNLGPKTSAWTFQQAILLCGRIGEDENNTRSGTLVIYHNQNFLPPISSRVVESQFKQLVRLQSGPNFIRLDYVPDSRTSVGSASAMAHSTTITLHYMPPPTPPLQLAILVASDSNGTYDAVPGRIQLEGNNLQVAVRKYRMAAYMWQAFTAEQMRRNGFGARTFHLEEKWQPTTLTYHPAYANRLGQEVEVHIIRLKQTMAEIRSMDYAQQNKDAQNKGELYTIAMDACHEYFKPQGNQTYHVAAMYLDTHWDPATKVIRGHAALGGGNGQIQLAIFGSHCLQSYPASLDQVNETFTDATRTDLNYVGNDCGNCGSSWEAANVGIAAHLHEVGHLFGCPHQESGLMAGDYFAFSRSFCMWEAFATRTGTRAHALTDRSQESVWNRLDLLRFRFHPAFARPGHPAQEPPLVEDTVQTWAIEKSVILTSSAGIAWIEFFGDGDDVCRFHLEYYHTENNNGPKQLSLSIDKLKTELPERLRLSKRLRLEIYSMGLNGHATIDDLYDFISSGKIKINGNTIQSRLPDRLGRTAYAFRGKKLGFSQMQNSQPGQVLFLSIGDLTKVMTSIVVYYGDAVDGMEFVYADGETQLFGKRGGKPGGTEFKLETRLGEQLFGFYVRAGQWIDGIQIWTTRNRKSEMFGNANGGSGHLVTPPLGYSVAGVAGSCGAWLDGLQLLITR